MDTNPQEYARRITEFWTEDKFIRHDYARDVHGRSVSSFSADAVKFCALGVINYVVPSGLRGTFEDIVNNEARKLYHKPIISVNDDLGYQEAYTVFDRIANPPTAWERIKEALFGR